MPDRIDDLASGLTIHDVEPIGSRLDEIDVESVDS